MRAKGFILTIVICSIISWFISGYFAKSYKKDEVKRFNVIYTQGSDFTKEYIIIRDSETQLEYLLIKKGYGAGVIKL